MHSIPIRVIGGYGLILQSFIGYVFNWKNEIRHSKVISIHNMCGYSPFFKL